jgi:uncharacterized RDD family membrane protein YckC
MKCPKCSYLGFERSDRCRNCGYDFSLAPAAELELDMRRAQQQPRPIDDLTLVDAAAAPRSAVAMLDAGPDLDRLFGEPSAAASPVPSQELPLFGPPIPDDDRPLITKISPPRTPMSVRRATPQVPRLRAEQPRVQSFDLALDAEPDAPAPAIVAPLQPSAREIADSWSEPAPTPHHGPEIEAAVASRFVAVVIDVMILALIDVAVVYFTMRICGVSLTELGLLPKGPLLAFLLVQNGGYLVTFTAGGQTLGKMAAGIRVIGTGSDESLDLGRAFLRTLMWLVLAIPAGLGFCTALLGRDHRGLHDHFAGTRVVRATA